MSEGTDMSNAVTGPVPVIQSEPTAAPPDWYETPSGEMRWWDGAKWTEHRHTPQYAPQPYQQPYQQYSQGPMTHQELNVRREVVYTRPQTGHSAFAHLGLAFITCGISLIWTVYFVVSPNHYFHA